MRCVASRLPPGVLSWMISAGDVVRGRAVHGFLDVAGHDVVDDAGARADVDRGGRSAAGAGRGSGPPAGS